jgi:hypothetical protein
VTLERSILQVLALAAPRLVLPQVLVNHVREAVIPAPTPGETAEKLAQMEAAALIVSVRDSIDQRTIRYGLTDAGRAWLQSHQ